MRECHNYWIEWEFGKTFLYLSWSWSLRRLTMHTMINVMSAGVMIDEVTEDFTQSAWMAVWLPPLLSCYGFSLELQSLNPKHLVAWSSQIPWNFDISYRSQWDRFILSKYQILHLDRIFNANIRSFLDQGLVLIGQVGSINVLIYRYEGETIFVHDPSP